LGIRVVDSNWLRELIFTKKCDFFNSEWNFHSLPYQIRLEIFRYLSPSDLGNSQRVCKRWHTVCKSNELWKSLLSVSLGSDYSTSLTTKEIISVTNYNSYMKLFTKRV